jgi:hypothetical protein
VIGKKLDTRRHRNIMLAIQLKNYLSEIADEANILIYVNKTNETRQLLFGDLDATHDGNIVIDAEYEVPVKKTVIERGK